MGADYSPLFTQHRLDPARDVFRQVDVVADVGEQLARGL
jgi:hypothetical protein